MLRPDLTNYSALIDEIEYWRSETREQVCYVTFNYDSMLEDALIARLDLGFRIQSIDSYVSHPSYAVVKLHGSINWGQLVDAISNGSKLPPVARRNRGSELDVQGMIDMWDRLRISESYVLVDDYPILRVNDALVVPAIAIPVQNKDKFVCPTSHLDWLQLRLRTTTKIVTVGWRATESSFLELLQREIHHPVDLFVVSSGSDGAGETSANLAQWLEFGHARSVTDGFSGLINDSGKLAAFLRGNQLAANA